MFKNASDAKGAVTQHYGAAQQYVSDAAVNMRTR